MLALAPSFRDRLPKERKGTGTFEKKARKLKLMKDLTAELKEVQE